MNTRANKHFIIAAYYFPPLGLAGTARPLAMANFLARQGYPVSVLTVKPIAYPEYDESQSAALDPRIQVYRAGSSDPARVARQFPFAKTLFNLVKRSRRQAGSLIFPDSKVGFVKPALKALKSLIRPNAENILITTSPPMSIHRLGLKSTGWGGVEWVADFRDIWGSLSLEYQPEDFRDKALEYLTEITNAAGLITATSPLTIDYLQTEVNAAADYFFLPNGYDESDFAAPVSERTSHFGIYGTLNNLIGIERLLRWIAELRRASSNFEFSLRHVGYLDLPDLDDLLAKYRLSGCFQSLGYLSHHESIQAIRKTAANIIMLSDELDTSYIIPSKLFELLRAEPPLIAILPPGNAARLLLEEHNFTGVHIVDSAAELEHALARLDKTGALRIRSGVDRFERNHELKGFLSRLEELL